MRIDEPKPMKIQASDVISGSLYLKLISDYREYDKRQKEYILSLESRVSELMEVLEETRTGRTKELFKKLERRKRTIFMQGGTIRKLKNENAELLCKLALQNLNIIKK